jgi:hypothetical protein
MLVSPISVAVLMAYFRVDEEELLLRKARVEVAIHSWVLNGVDKSVPVSRHSRPIRRKHRDRSRRGKRSPPVPVPEWKRARPRAGRAWEPAEDAALLSEFDAGLSLEDIAARRGRGIFAIEVRLCKLGRAQLLAVRDRDGDGTRSAYNDDSRRP